MDGAQTGSSSLAELLTDIGWPAEAVRLANRCAAELRANTQRDVAFTITPRNVTITPCLERTELAAEIQIAVIAMDGSEDGAGPG